MDSEQAEEQSKQGLSAYRPLIVLILLSALSSFSLQLSRNAGGTVMSGMHDFTVTLTEDVGMALMAFAMLILP